MFDMTSKVRKRCGAVLADGEHYRCAVFAQGAGSVRRQVAFGAVFGGLGQGAVPAALGARAGDAASKGEREADAAARGEGAAATLPSFPCVLAVTDRRLLAFEFKKMRGAPGDLIAELPLSEVAAVGVEPGTLVAKLAIGCTDESAMTYEVGRAAKPDAATFAEALGAALRG